MGLDGAKRERALEIVERNAVALSQLVSDVLDVSKIVAGKTRLDARRTDVPVVTLAAIDSLKPTFESKGVTIDYFMDPETSPVWGDPDRLQQVAWNLLTNAVKFTPRGGRVEVRVSDVDGHVEVSVSDTGTGIAEEFLPRLFDRFSQADSRATRVFGGLGLGLALVKHYVELHAGTVAASSDGLGKGATFRVRLPPMIAQRESSEPAAVLVRRLAGDASNGGPLRGLTVLAVDDDRDSLLLVSDALQAAGASVVCAGSAAAALEILSRDSPDVIVSDLSMPGMDGYQFMQSLRTRDARHGGSIPAAALTAYPRSQDRARALMAGYQTHLAKPIDPSELISIVAALGRLHPYDQNAGR
jgi:CheY-like chemotaxis protein